ncbi:hypothetical protein CH267_06765 [Rhodococcus sp. 06-621-2]|nr:biosynthetic peptidoglycan transglycosylase [Rhodococcus sp. 06-621-2]OZC59784.1 hypothetical protein CH267_06765 [Rhodococcus sp. 06-621-2]
MTTAPERTPTDDNTHRPISGRERYRAVDAVCGLISIVFRLHLLAVALLLVVTLLLMVWTPPRTMFMLNDPRPDIPFVQNVADLDHVSRYVVAAVLLHEDAHLGDRFLPFDVSHFIERGRRHASGEDDLSGSTIPQQLAKNLYFTRGKNFVRKGYEVPISFALDWMLSDERLIELYINEAQFAQNLYGICSASWYYFDSAPWSLTQTQAVMLAGLLPSGDFAKRSPDGGIDLSNPESSATETVWRALEVIPKMLEQWGGWETVVNSIGITDVASDHAADRNSDRACSTMPQDVAARISWEDVRRR